jgi:AcrR family transcriptional regulator
MLDVARSTGAAARRERGRQEMRAAIIDEARRLVDAAGLDAVTIRAIARALGYSPGALYEYFDSKEAIVEALYFEGAGGLGGHMEGVIAALPPGASSVEAIIALGHGYRAFALEHAELYRLIFGGLKELPSPRPGDKAEDNQGGFGTLVRVAHRGVEDGTFTELPPPVIAVAAWSAVHGFVALELSGHIDGCNWPGLPPPSPDEGRQRRNQLFDAHIRMTLFGLVRRQEHGPTATFRPAQSDQVDT